MQIIISILCLVAVLLCFAPSASYADVSSETCSSELSSDEKNSKLWTVNLTGIGIITVWGVAQWDYFSSSPKTTSEGWFGNDTDSGGVDKLGHAYTSYVTTRGLSYLYESWCINKDDAALYGALSSLAIVTYMEFGDAFSDFGASKEDMVANTAGVLYGYYSYKYPRLSSILDYRWEYKLGSETLGDFATDYENTKYLLALKLNGFDFFSQNNFLKHIELHAGYYTRGFSDGDDNRERNVYVGIGFNFTDLFRRHSYNKASTLFKYYQIPGSTLTVEKDLNQ